MRKQQTATPAYVQERARALRNNATFTERLLWSRLRKRQLGGFKFRRQQALGRYIVDFCSFDGNVIIEIDGTSHNGQEEYDRIRDEWLQSTGVNLKILHYSTAQIADPQSREQVLSDILRACNSHKENRAK